MQTPSDWHDVFQDGFCPTDVQFRSLPSMSEAMMQRMLPGVTINKVSLHEGISSLKVMHVMHVMYIM